jgi:hypothetical protein
MIYGYARVSTASQNLSRQYKIIKDAYPDAVIYSEKYTGSTLDRPEWDKLKTRVKPGDVIVFEDISRFSRDDAESAFALYKELVDKGIELEFISKPHLNTTEYKKNGCIKVPTSNMGLKFDSGLSMMLEGIVEKQFISAFEQSAAELHNIHKNIVQGMAASDKKAGHRKGDTFMTKKETIALDIIRQGLEAGDDDDTIKIRIEKAYKRELSDAKHKTISDVTYYKYKQHLLGRDTRAYSDNVRTRLTLDIIKHGLDDGLTDDEIKSNIKDTIGREYPKLKHPGISQATYDKYKTRLLDDAKQ